jgi:Glycosyltransferases, probably involved in cell wall biogenesis
MVDISIIMAVYNTPNKKILIDSIESILNQTYKNFEFIICDDASNDSTYEILKEICKDSRIKLIRNKINNKSGKTRNRCIEIAKGKYIALMDADDISLFNRIEKQYNFLESHNEYDFVGCKGIYFCNYIGDMKDEYWFCPNPEKKDFLFTLPFVHASIMFRRHILDQIHGYSNSKWVIRAEDYDLLMRLYQKGFNGGNINDTVYYIRLDKKSYKRRKYRYRIIECLVRFKGFYNLELMPKGIIYSVKPLLIGLIPNKLRTQLQKIYYKNK